MSRVKKTKTIWRVLLQDFCWFSFVRNSLCLIKIGPKTVPWIQIMLVKNIVLMFWYWAMHMGLITHNNFSVKRKDSGVGSDENFKKTFQRYFYVGHENTFTNALFVTRTRFSDQSVYDPIFTCSFTWSKHYFHPSKRSHFMRVLWSRKRKSKQRRPEINPQVRSIEFACHSSSFNEVGFKLLWYILLVEKKESHVVTN